MTYAEYQTETAPTWMQRAWGVAWNYVQGLQKDAWLEAAKAAVKARMALLAPEDALPYLLRDYVLDAAYTETVAQTRARIVNAWSTWSKAGTAVGVLDALATAGYPSAFLQERITEGRWWDFRVLLRPPFPWDHAGKPILRMGHGWTVGNAFLTGVAPAGEAARVLAIVRKWKPKHENLTHVAVQLDGPIVGLFSIGDGSVIDGVTLYWS